MQLLENLDTTFTIFILQAKQKVKKQGKGTGDTAHETGKMKYTDIDTHFEICGIKV